MVGILKIAYYSLKIKAPQQIIVRIKRAKPEKNIYFNISTSSIPIRDIKFYQSNLFLLYSRWNRIHLGISNMLAKKVKTLSIKGCDPKKLCSFEYF